MGNANSKNGASGEGADDGFRYAEGGGWLSEAARSKGSLNGSLALHDTIAQGHHPSVNTNVVSRHQQVFGQAGWLGDSLVHIKHANARIAESSAMASASPTRSSVTAAVAHPTPVSATQQIAQRAVDELGHPWIHLANKHEELQSETQIATMIQWKHGGSEVLLEGSWDNWLSRVPLQKAGKDFTILKFLGEGVYHYRFLVDGQWRHAPDLPYVFDEKGVRINVLDLQESVPENLEGVVDLHAPGSPESSYDSPFPGAEDYSKEPPLLPQQLHHNNELERACRYSASVAGGSNARPTTTRPQHVVLNHLFVETRRAASSPVLSLGFSQRFRSKYVTVVLHKPVRR